MGSTAKLAAVCLVTLGGAVGLWQLQRAPAETRGAEHGLLTATREVALEPAEAEGARDAAESAPAGAPAGRAPIQRTEAPSTPAAAGEPAAALLVTRAGRVVDLGGSPVSDVAVFLGSAPLRPPPPGVSLADLDAGLPGAPAAAPVASRAGTTLPVRTGADGSFRIELPSWSLQRPEVRDEAWITVAESSQGEAQTIVVARRGLLAGFVHDPDGQPLSGVRGSVLLLDGVYARVGVRPDGSGPSGSIADFATGEDGRFALERGPTGDGLLLLLEKDGYGSERISLGEVVPASLDVELEPIAGADVFWGVVVDAAGDPVEGATVSGGGVLVKTDAAGEFRLERGRQASMSYFQSDRVGTLLCAVLAGHLPAEVPITPELESPVVLRLGPPALTLRGRVVDGSGTPLAGVAVWSPDVSLLGLEMVEQARSAFGFMRSVEYVLSGSERHWAITEADGSFELNGLLDRDYAFRAYDPVRFLTGEELVVHPGGAEVELTLDTGRVSAVAGRLLSTAGEPLVGVVVQPMRLPSGFESWKQPQVSAERAPVVTDEDGAFAFEGLSTEHTTLSFMGARVKAFHAVRLAEESDLLQIEVRLGVRVSFFVDLSRDPGLASQMELLDAAGEPLELLRRSGNAEHASTRTELQIRGDENPMSAVFTVSDAARTLVLYRADEEVVRLSVQLTPGEVNRIAP